MQPTNLSLEVTLARTGTMKKLATALMLAMTMTAVGLATGVACGGEPAYLILRAPAREPKGSAYYPGRAYEVSTQTYAYGWFGAKPRGTWKRTTGYNSNYLQWSKR